MIVEMLGIEYPLLAFLGILTAFGCTCLILARGSKFLPKDQGREFAHDGKLSAGKPRGAGLIFVLVFVIVALLFVRINMEIVLYLVLVALEMFTGFFDDVSKKPWGEYKKGILDLLVSGTVATVFLYYNSNIITIALLDIQLEIPVFLYALLIMVLVWGSINVTNCTDGVDGLSGSLTIVTLASIYIIGNKKLFSDDFSYVILLFIVCILGYLWYNATPSNLMMGDAGSRAMGIFISIVILKMGMPFLYIPFAFMLIVDGGLGLLKIFLLRFLKIRILKNTRTPLHDYVRKDKGWSNSQTVFRFVIIQVVISMAAIYGARIGGIG